VLHQIQVEDLTKAYSEGDYIKAIVLKVDIEKRRVSLGLKPSYFIDADSSSDDDSDDDVLDSDSDTEDTKHIKQIKHATTAASKQATAAVGADDTSDEDNDNEVCST
jgi:rRNA biogenesis protein RRP5